MSYGENAAKVSRGELQNSATQGGSGALNPTAMTLLLANLIKIGAKVITHARYVIFQMAEVAVPRWLFRTILERIRRLRPPEAVPG